jgi:hypothetical protein
MPLRSQVQTSEFTAVRAYPPDLSKRQIQEEIPLGWRQDAGLWGYVTKYMLRGSGAGFVTPPYTAYWDRLWGATPIEDLPKYKDLYTFTPYIKAAVDVTVNLSISNGFELEGGDPKIRDWLTDWLDERNYLETLRASATDQLVFGNAYTELCREEGTNHIVWLKGLDPVHMRVRRDPYGQVLGYIQLLTMPPVVFPVQDVMHSRWGPKTWWYEYSYGTSLLRPLLKLQALIDQFEDDMAIISHLYTKPMLVIKGGTPEKPYNIDQLNQLIESFANRTVASDAVVRGDCSVDPIPSMTRQIHIEWWLEYLHKMREAVLGVPKIFMGESEGTNRATAEVVMQEYVTRLRMLQENNADQLETVLFKQLIQDNFGEGQEVPHIKWRPVWEPTVQDIGMLMDALFKDGIIEQGEARLKLGFPITPPQPENGAAAPRIVKSPEGSKTAARGPAYLIQRVE